MRERASRYQQRLGIPVVVCGPRQHHRRPPGRRIGRGRPHEGVSRCSPPSSRSADWASPSLLRPPGGRPCPSLRRPGLAPRLQRLAASGPRSDRLVRLREGVRHRPQHRSGPEHAARLLPPDLPADHLSGSRATRALHARPPPPRRRVARRGVILERCGAGVGRSGPQRPRVTVTTCAGLTPTTSPVSPSCSRASVPGLLRTAFCSIFSTSSSVPETSRVAPVLRSSFVEGVPAMVRTSSQPQPDDAAPPGV